MTILAKPAPFATPYGTLVEPATLRIERLLPGPIERVWAHLVESDLRRRWLAAGEMPLEAGAAFQLVWRNDELTDPPGRRPDDFGSEHRMDCRIIAVEPPTRLAFAFGNNGDVTIDLAARDDGILLTLVHRRLASPAAALMVGPGWHGHLDVLGARLAGETPQPFWDRWKTLRADYETRFSA